MEVNGTMKYIIEPHRIMGLPKESYNAWRKVYLRQSDLTVEEVECIRNTLISPNLLMEMFKRMEKDSEATI